MADVHAPLPVAGWAADPASPGTRAPERAPTPVDGDLVEIASGMAPGKALELGCGEGQNALWLARRSWIVNAVDPSPAAIAELRASAVVAGVSSTVVTWVADVTDWRPTSRYDLVVSVFALPARGMGRSRVLDTAAAAVAPGGTILLTEFDISLHRDGWMPEKYLVSTEELERHLDGFRINRSAVRVARHRHGYDERILPVANVIATRREDLRSF